MQVKTLNKFVKILYSNFNIHQKKTQGANFLLHSVSMPNYLIRDQTKQPKTEPYQKLLKFVLGLTKLDRISYYTPALRTSTLPLPTCTYASAVLWPAQTLCMLKQLSRLHSVLQILMQCDAMWLTITYDKRNEWLLGGNLMIKFQTSISNTWNQSTLNRYQRVISTLLYHSYWQFRHGIVIDGLWFHTCTNAANMSHVVVA